MATRRRRDRNGGPRVGNAIPGMRNWTAPMARVIGFALLLAFTSMQGIIGSQTPSIDGMDAWGVFVYRGAEALTFLGIALASHRIAGLAGRPALVWTCAGLCALAMGLRSFFGMGVPSTIPLFDVSMRIARGVGEAALWMAWIELYARMDMRHVLVDYLAANVAAAVLTLVLSAGVPHAPVLFVSALLPLGSAPLLLFSSRELDRTAFAHEEPPSRTPRFPAAPMALMAVFTLANIFARNLLPAEDRVYATLGALACLAMLFVALRLGSVRFGIWPLCGVAFPLALAGLFGLLLEGSAWGIASTLCTHGGEALFAVFIGVVLCNISFRYGMSALALFGYTKAAGSLASLAGGALASTVEGAVWNSRVLAVAGTALALSVCYVALTRNRGLEITWGVDPDPGQNSDGIAHKGADSEETRREHLLSRCSRVAYERGLTRREEQVLVLLAQDKSMAAIEEELCVSNSTVKSHTNAVYRKLGMHSRAEVVEFIAQVRDETDHR